MYLLFNNRLRHELFTALNLFSCVFFGRTCRRSVMDLGSSHSQRCVISVLIISFAQYKSNQGESQRSPAERETSQLIKNK